MKQPKSRFFAHVCWLLCGHAVLFAAPLPAEEKTDLFGDPLPPGAIVRLGSLQFASAGRIHAAAVSGDGKTLLAGCTDRPAVDGPVDGSVILLWDIKTGKEQGRIPAGDGHIMALAMPADRKQVWTVQSFGAGKKMLRRYFFDEKRWLEDFAVNHRLNPQQLHFSADESLVVVVGRNGVEVFDRDAKFLRTHKASSACDYCPATGLVACDKEKSIERTIEFYRISDGTLVRQIDAERARVSNLGFSADGKVLAVVERPSISRRGMSRNTETLRLFDESGKSTLSREVARSDDRFVLSPNGELLVDDNVWAVKTGEQIAPKVGQPVAFIDGGKRLVTRWPHSLQVRNTTTWEIELGQHSDAGFRKMAVSPDEKLAATLGNTGVIHLWEIATGKLRWRFHPPGLEVTSIAFTADGRHLILGSRGRLSLCDLELPRLAKHHLNPNPDSSPKVLWASPDGKLLAAGHMWGIEVYSAEFRLVATLPTEKTGLLLQLHNLGPNRIEFSTDNKYVAAVDRETAVVWNLESKKVVYSTSKRMPRASVGFRDEGKFAFVEGGSSRAEGGSLKTVKLATGELESLDIKSPFLPNAMTIMDDVLIGIGDTRTPDDNPLILPLKEGARVPKIKSGHYEQVIGLPKTRRFILGHANGAALVFEMPPRGEKAKE